MPGSISADAAMNVEKTKGAIKNIEKTEGAIKNGQCRDTGYTGYKTQTKQKVQHRKLKDEQHRPHKKPVLNPCALEG